MADTTVEYQHWADSPPGALHVLPDPPPPTITMAEHERRVERGDVGDWLVDTTLLGGSLRWFHCFRIWPDRGYVTAVTPLDQL